jgi:hypothetical protein
LSSCECPSEIDTPRQNTPNSFSQIDVYNYTGRSSLAFSNNVEIETVELGNNGYSNYFSGSTIFSLKENDDTFYSSSIKTDENLSYTLLLYENSGRIKSKLSENLDEIKVRIFNLSNDFLILNIDENNFEIAPNDYLNFENIPIGGDVTRGQTTKGILFNGFSETNINNIIINQNLDYQYFQSF